MIFPNNVPVKLASAIKKRAVRIWSSDLTKLAGFRQHVRRPAWRRASFLHVRSCISSSISELGEAPDQTNVARVGC